MPEVGDHDARPFSIPDGGRDGADDLNLPRTVIEGLRDSVIAPLPLAFRGIVKNGVEFVKFQVATDVREPRHGNDVTVGGLDNAAFAKPLLSWVCGNKGSALLVGKCWWDVGVPKVAPVGGEHGIFSPDVQNLTVDVRCEVVFTAISTI